MASVWARDLILTSLVCRSRTAFTVSIQRRPIRSMATTTRVSPETSLALRARQPARLLVPVPPEDTHVAVDVVLGDALLAELVGLGFGVAAGGSLDALPAGPDIAVSRHAGTIPLCGRTGPMGE